MAIETFEIPRVEGRLRLLQADNGHIRVAGGRTRWLEAHLVGRSMQEAVYLTQQLCGPGGISHALAAAQAWEQAGLMGVPENGRLARELLSHLAFIQAHIHQFYFQALPDYLPLSQLGRYRGPRNEVRRVADGLASLPDTPWASRSMAHPFGFGESQQLSENWVDAERVSQRLGQMMAALGGKYPVAMNITAGGMAVRIDRPLLMRLRDMLNEISPWLEEKPMADGLMVVSRMGGLAGLGRGTPYLVSFGSQDADRAIFPRGISADGHLQPLEGQPLESVINAYYRLSKNPDVQTAMEAWPDKEGAYSWIKAPRVGEMVMETGAIGRLVVTQLTGAHTRSAQTALRIEETLQTPLIKANTVGGRMLARLGEVAMLAARCQEILDKLEPGGATVQDGDGLSVSGNGVGQQEAPAGAVQHRVWLDDGVITGYDIISPSTFNGSPEDEFGVGGPLETALNRPGLNLKTEEGRRTASRIVHSFAFSAYDAVH